MESGICPDHPGAGSPGVGGVTVQVSAFLRVAAAVTGLAANALWMGGKVVAQSPQCRAPEYRQLDFWAGDWDTYERGGADTSVARNLVEVILDGCVVREVYQQKDGLIGHSFSMYDAHRKTWHQTWVTNRGQLLMLDGGLDGDRMILQGTTYGLDGRPSLLRGIWKREGDAVREIAESSADGGKVWKPVFDITFRRHKE